MRDHSKHLPTNPATRAGIATLEFVMALPVLLLLMVAITWLGFSVIGQTEVLVQARNSTWKQRFKDASGKPLYFPVLTGFYDQKSDYVTEKASKKVEVSPIFNALPGPEGSHTILAGSWDFEALKLDKPPDFKLMAVAAAVGMGGNVLDWLTQIDNPLGAVKKLGGGVQKEAENAPSTVGKDDGTSSPDSGGGTGPGPDGKTPDQAKEDTEKQREGAIKLQKEKYKDLGGRIELIGPRAGVVQPVRGKLKATNDEIIKLQAERVKKFLVSQQETDEEKKKKLQEELAQMQRTIDLKKITYQRLEAEFLDTAAELDALGVDMWDQLSI